MLEETGSTYEVTLRSIAHVKDRIAGHLKKKRWQDLGNDTETLRALMQSIGERTDHLRRKAHEELLFHPAGKAKFKFEYKADNYGRNFATPHREMIEQGIEFVRRVLGPEGMGTRKVAVNFHDDRAYYLKGEIFINPAKRGYDATTVHELGHWIDEKQKGVLDETVAFLKRRTEGEKLVKLRDLFPRYNYRENEKTRPDQFMHPYIGKKYGAVKASATEVLSMGLEEMYRNPIGLAKADPDMFDFIYDLIRRDFKPKDNADNP
jgi:hypothetical protein